MEANDTGNDGRPSRVVIVAEHGTNWGQWVDKMRHRAHDVEVIVRHANERLVAFALRVQAFVVRRREPIGIAVLLSGDDDTLFRGWEVVTRAIQRALVATGQIVLVSPATRAPMLLS